MFDSIRKLIFGRRPRETAVDRSTSVDPRRFEARVRDVADIASAISRTAADVHRNTDLPDWELALSLVDREPQVEKLSERLDEFVKEGPGRSLLVIVLGSSLDCHRYFPARCGTWDLEKRTGQKWDYLGTLKWSASLPRVFEEIGAKFNDDHVHDVGSLNGLLKQQDKYICFSHIVDGEVWYRDQGKTLRDWVAIFAEEKLTVHPERFLIAFLCLQLRVPQTDYCTKLEKIVKEWEAARRPAIVVMPPLNLVRQIDLQTWPDEASRRLRRKIQLGEVEIGSIFVQDEARYMLHVAAALQKQLQSQFEAGPRVMDTSPWQ